MREKIKLSLTTLMVNHAASPCESIQCSEQDFFCSMSEMSWLFYVSLYYSPSVSTCQLQLLPWGPGGPGTPCGPGNPSLPGGPGGPWTCGARMPAGVFCSAAAPRSLPAVGETKLLTCRITDDVTEQTTQNNGGIKNVLPSMTLSTSFWIIIFSSSMKPGSPCVWKKNTKPTREV